MLFPFSQRPLRYLTYWLDPSFDINFYVASGWMQLQLGVVFACQFLPDVRSFLFPYSDDDETGSRQTFSASAGPVRVHQEWNTRPTLCDIQTNPTFSFHVEFPYLNRTRLFYYPPVNMLITFLHN